MAEIEASNLYDMNKQLTLQETPLTDQEIKQKLDKVAIPFIRHKYSSKYFMLLCREQYNFTLFSFAEGKTEAAIENAALIDLYECLINRGQVISIDLTEAKDAIEIWIVDNEEAACYYFFPYDIGVIEVNPI